MVRSPAVRRALAAATATAVGSLPLLAGLAVGPPATAAAASPAAASSAPSGPASSGPAIQVLEPLSVEITTMSPSVVPESGPIRVSGTVTNIDIATWSTINLYPFIGAAPMTTRAELAEAVTVPVDQDVGGRITDFGPLDTVEELEPGDSYAFTLTVPRSYYDAAAGGVYWFGVHALGEGPRPRDLVADGRARTFLPQVPPPPRATPRAASTTAPGPATPRVPTSVVVPLRRLISYDADGALANPDDWARTLDAGGRMRGLVDFGAAAGPRSITWLIDPALLDAVRRLAVGNPPRSLAPTQPADPSDPDPTDPTDPSGSPSATDGESGGDEPSDVVTVTPGAPTEGPDEPAEELDPEAAALAALATDWLADLEDAVQGREVLTLPYGDLDVAATAQHDPALYALATSRPGAVLESWDVTTEPAVGSPSGYLDAAALSLVPADTTVLVTDRMLPGGADAPTVSTSGGRRLVATSTGAASGGPLPGERLSSLGLRQRLLSEAALRALSDEPQPLVMVLPVRWTPTDVTDFFDGLSPTWLDLTPLAQVRDTTATEVATTDLSYPRRQAERELDDRAFAALEGLVAAGEKLQNLLTRNDQVASVVTDQALSSASYAAREAPQAARSAVADSRTWIDARLGSVEVDAPPGVTLSSASGSFAATLTNALDEPVTVVVAARSDRGIVVSDSEEVQLAPGSTTTILLAARTLRLGVHDVTLYVTDTDGMRLGSSDRLPIRSGQVSTVIWVIIASGAGILFVAIGARLVRRFRRRGAPA